MSLMKNNYSNAKPTSIPTYKLKKIEVSFISINTNYWEKLIHGNQNVMMNWTPKTDMTDYSLS